MTQLQFFKMTWVAELIKADQSSEVLFIQYLKHLQNVNKNSRVCGASRHTLNSYFPEKIEQSNTLLLLYLTLLHLLSENSKFLRFYYITWYFSLINAIRVRGELDGHFLT